MNFNESQLRAIAVCDGPAMVLAGAGSGKTTVITHRIQALIEQHHVDPSNILVITFTKAAATEMKERFLDLMGLEKSRVTFGTFHAIFFMVLKIAYHFDASNIITESQKYNLLRELVHKYRLDARDENDLCSNLNSEISGIKNSRLDIQHFYSKVCSASIFRDIYRDYNRYLADNRLIDFDDMLTYTLELFEQRPDILAIWQKKYKYILIDEFQDINQIQFDIIRLMALPENNLFVVGDDDQSIYRFRGSKPEIMLRFKDIYPDTKEILLNRNYRCNKKICDKAMKLISHNRVRFEKVVTAERPEEDSFRIMYFDSEEQENTKIAELIREAYENGDSLDDYAVLFRTNTGPRLLMEEFLNKNIEFRCKDQIPNLYEHWTVRDVRTYIRLAVGSRERSEVYKIMNRPLRYLSRDSLPERQVAFDVWEAYYNDKPWVQERIFKLEQDLRLIAQMSPYAAINYIRKGVGYDEYLIDFAEEHDLTKEELLSVLDEFQNAAKGYKTFAEFNDHIKNTEEALQEMQKKSNTKVNAVTFSTLHSAKGLEYKNVFIIDVNEGNIPYKKAILDEEIEEERRLMYVGMTRAKDNLYLCSVKSTHHGPLVSRFIEELIQTD
ncbi:MAG: ATP-dependent helicase [Lachnospiraceae bacterium]|nr:ATP-dependent helicase [Lachnospiraceae bacterium]